MVCACVDIGTNTTRVLVADVQDGRLTEVLQQRAFTRIGMHPEIAPEKIAEVADVVAEQVALAREAGAAGVRVVATAAIRTALNRDEFLAGMTVEVEILDEDEEARMAFLGATQTLGRGAQGTVAVVDVGGGSTEIAVGTRRRRRRLERVVPRRLGRARRPATCAPTRPRSSELRAARDHAMDVLATRAFPAADCAVAVGGSAASLRTVVGDALDPRSLKTARWASSAAARRRGRRHATRSTPSACGCCRPGS